MPEQVPGIGRIVHYRLTEQNAEWINQSRKQAAGKGVVNNWGQSGEHLHAGNRVEAGDTFPMTIVQVWGNEATSAVNGQVFLDGNDVFWATSVAVGEGPGTFSWPTRS